MYVDCNCFGPKNKFFCLLVVGSWDEIAQNVAQFTEDETIISQVNNFESFINQITQRRRRLQDPLTPTPPTPKPSPRPRAPSLDSLNSEDKALEKRLQKANTPEQRPRTPSLDSLNSQDKALEKRLEKANRPVQLPPKTPPRASIGSLPSLPKSLAPPIDLPSVGDVSNSNVNPSGLPRTKSQADLENRNNIYGSSFFKIFLLHKKS